MSVNPCRECGEPVSSQAAKCPHCGCPFPTSAAGYWAVTLTRISVGAIVLLLLLSAGRRWGAEPTADNLPSVAAPATAMPPLPAASAPETVDEPRRAPVVAANEPPPRTPAVQKLLGLGDEARISNGHRGVLLGWDPQARPTGKPPQPGYRFAAVDVELCAGTTFFHDAGNMFNFYLVFADHTRLGSKVYDDRQNKQPRLISTDLRAGMCVRGWITFEIAIDAAPLSVVYTRFQREEMRWQLPSE